MADRLAELATSTTNPTRSATPHRDYTFLGTTQSLCPECLAVVPAKIINRAGRVYFRKTCPEHGTRDDFVCSDAKHYDQMEFALPARMPAVFGVEPDKGCPLDCGLCTEHEQHTCVGVLEITSSCNLTCPMCYAGSSPGGKHLSLADAKRQIDRLVEVEGRAEVCQLSGGEPTIHPQFEEIVEYALSRPIDYVMINTNGIRFARDESLVEIAARHKDRLEVYFQFDGLSDDVYRALRGEPLLDTKLAALEALGRAGVHVTLVATLQGGVNDDQMGPLVQFGLSKPWITGISFQPATYSGRHVLPEQLERRITFPDVIKGVAAQTKGLFREDDFLPLPCAHPNCHQIAIAYRTKGTAIPVTRFIDARANLDLLANGISFTRAKSRDLILSYLGRQACCGGNCGPEMTNDQVPMTQQTQNPIPITENSPADDFFSRVVAEELGAENLFRITITSFLDAYNFDVRRVMKCCTHHVLPSGHVIPFCAYNVLYRNGHVPLPALREALTRLVNHDLRYALVMFAAVAILSLLLRRWQARLPLAWWQKLGLGVGGFCGAMIGAKLPFALADWQGLASGTTWLSDGKTIMCGIVGGYFGVEVAKWTLDIRIKTGDTFAVPVAIAVAIGRLACFVGGCCYGTPTSLPWGVQFSRAGDALARHPTQLYEAAFHLAVAAILFALQQRGIFRGQLVKLYILVYLAYRFVTEFIRPEPRLWLGLTGYQWAALALAPVFAWLWWRDAARITDGPMSPGLKPGPDHAKPAEAGSTN